MPGLGPDGEVMELMRQQMAEEYRKARGNRPAADIAEPVKFAEDVPIPTTPEAVERYERMLARLAEVEAERDALARENRRLREERDSVLADANVLADALPASLYEGAVSGAVHRINERAEQRAEELVALAPAAVEQDGAREGQEQP